MRGGDRTGDRRSPERNHAASFRRGTAPAQDSLIGLRLLRCVGYTANPLRLSLSACHTTPLSVCHSVGICTTALSSRAWLLAEMVQMPPLRYGMTNVEGTVEENVERHCPEIGRFTGG